MIQLLEDTENPDFVDFKQSLIEKERKKNYGDSSEQIKKLQERYTDTILLFDLDPQDSRYDAGKVINFLRVFNESSDKGKLYLSYPMIEALFDSRDCIPFPSPKGEYKKQIKDVRNDLYKNFTKNKLAFKDCQDMLNAQFVKAGKITPYNGNFHLNLFDKQSCMIDSKNKIYVISTALFFLIDYWGNKVMQVNSSEEL